MTRRLNWLGIGIMVLALVLSSISVTTVHAQNNASFNKSDSEAIEAFATNYVAFYSTYAQMGASPTIEQLNPLLGELESKNDALQGHSFSNRISNNYLTNADATKASANRLTDLSSTATAGDLNNRSTTSRAMQAEYDIYQAAVVAVNTSADDYDASTDPVLQQQAMRNALIGGGVVAIVIIVILIAAMLAARRRKPTNVSLFDGDKAATKLSSADRKLLTAFAGNVVQYEKILEKNTDVTRLDAIQKLSYDQDKAVIMSTESLGIYRFIVYEFAALISLRRGDSAQAATLIKHAVEIKGDAQLLTPRARMIATTLQ